MTARSPMRRQRPRYNLLVHKVEGPPMNEHFDSMGELLDFLHHERHHVFSFAVYCYMQDEPEDTQDTTDLEEKKEVSHVQ